MKTSKDPRHLNRIKVMQELFAWDFNQDEWKQDRTKLVIDHVDQIDKIIKGAAPERPVDKINKIDLAILRLAVFELIIEKEVPEKVIVDEAVELGKGYGSDSSPAFINGVLGRIIAGKI